MLTKKEKQIILDAFESIYEDELNFYSKFIPCPFDKIDAFKKCDFCHKLFPKIDKKRCPIEDIQLNLDCPYERFDLLIKTERLIESLRNQFRKERIKSNFIRISKLLSYPQNILNKTFIIPLKKAMLALTIIQNFPNSQFLVFMYSPVLNLRKTKVLSQKQLKHLLIKAVDIY